MCSYFCFSVFKRRECYMCLQQNPLLLAWWLYWRGKPFGFHSPSRCSPISQVKMLYAITHVVTFLYYYRLWQPSGSTPIRLSAFGHPCLRVHNGYKVFDLRRRTVRRICSPELRSERLGHLIRQAQTVGRQRFGPQLLRWNIEQGWYEEEYINGRPLNSIYDFKAFLAPLFCRVLLVSPRRVVRAREYAGEQYDIFATWARSLSPPQAEVMRVKTLQEYLLSLLDPLQGRENQEIYLVRSHGDPTASNSVELNGEALLIDWKQIAFRSALFDCFEFFFSRLRRHYDRNPGMPRELAKAINDVERRLLSSPGDNSWIGSVVSSADTYRLIYYVERLVKGRTQADKHIFAFDWFEKRVRDEA